MLQRPPGRAPTCFCSINSIGLLFLRSCKTILSHKIIMTRNRQWQNKSLSPTDAEPSDIWGRCQSFPGDWQVHGCKYHEYSVAMNHYRCGSECAPQLRLVPTKPKACVLMSTANWPGTTYSVSACMSVDGATAYWCLINSSSLRKLTVTPTEARLRLT